MVGRFSYINFFLKHGDHTQKRQDQDKTTKKLTQVKKSEKLCHVAIKRGSRIICFSSTTCLTALNNCSNFGLKPSTKIDLLSKDQFPDTELYFSLRLCCCCSTHRGHTDSTDQSDQYPKRRTNPVFLPC